VIALDVNVLIYAFRRDCEEHGQYKKWLDTVLEEDQAIGLSDIVLSSFVRITTHPKVFSKPSSLAQAFGFCDSLWSQPNVMRLVPGDRHWTIFADLCKSAGAKGNLITDAYLAALAIESGAEWVTTDRDFARFPKLRWRHPLHK
jgi:toxin-antitoxin system PIN domain toxin